MIERVDCLYYFENICWSRTRSSISLLSNAARHFISVIALKFPQFAVHVPLSTSIDTHFRPHQWVKRAHPSRRVTFSLHESFIPQSHHVLCYGVTQAESRKPCKSQMVGSDWPDVAASAQVLTPLYLEEVLLRAVMVLLSIICFPFVLDLILAKSLFHALCAASPLPNQYLTAANTPPV